MKMKKVMLLLIILIAIGGGLWVIKKMNNNKESENIKTSQTENTKNVEQEKKSTTEQTSPTKQELVLAEFSTKIHNKAEERQNNITITCRALNGKEIKPGETFSFCNTVGEATTSKGYKEAEIYVDGEKKQGLGGGNCQVSTTIYNAVLQIPELEVVERHAHSNHVTYIEEGKDAAVAYGSYDLKFKNNSQDTIKIIMENTENDVIARIVKI